MENFEEAFVQVRFTSELLTVDQFKLARCQYRLAAWVETSFKFEKEDCERIEEA